MRCRMRALLTYVKVAILFATFLQHVCGDSNKGQSSNGNQQSSDTEIPTSNVPQTTTTTPRTGFFLSYTRGPSGTSALTETTTKTTTSTSTTTRILPTALSSTASTSTASTTLSQQQSSSKDERSATTSTTLSSVANTLLIPTSTPASTVRVTGDLTTSAWMSTTTTGSTATPTSTPASTTKMTGDLTTSTTMTTTSSSDASNVSSTTSALLPSSSEENGQGTSTSSNSLTQTSSSPTVTQTSTTLADLSSSSTTTTTTTSSTSQAAAVTASSTTTSSSGHSITSSDVLLTQTSSSESTISLVASISSSTPSDYSTTVSTTSVQPDTSSSITAPSSSSTSSRTLESSTQSSTNSVVALDTTSSEPSSSSLSSTASTTTAAAATTTTLSATTTTTTTPASSSALSSTSEQPTTTTTSMSGLQSPTSTSPKTHSTTSTQSDFSVSSSRSSRNESKSTTVNSENQSKHSTQSSTVTQSQPNTSTSSNLPGSPQGARGQQRDNRNYCSEDFSSYLNWPVTVVSSTFYQPCPFEGDGIASRQCYQNTTNGLAAWSAVNLGGCTKESDLLRQIKELKLNETNLDTPAILALVASTLARRTSRVRLSADQLLTYSKVLYQQASHRATHKLPLFEEELSDVADIVDNLLSSINADAWYNQSNNSAAVNVLSAINTYGDLWAKQEASNVTILKENIVIQTGSTSSQNRYPLIDDSTDWTDIKDSGIFISNITRTAILRAVGSDQYVYSCSMMRNMASYLNATQTANKSIANNLIISLSISNFVSTAASEAAFDITVTNTRNVSSQNTTVQCVYWDFISNNWSSENCSGVTLTHNSDYTTCSCNHLTNFAILVSPYSGPSPDSVLGQALSYISLIGCIVSAVCCFLTVVVYVVQWKIVKSHRAVVLINLCIALIVANVVFLAGADKTNNKDACTAVAALLHYFFLAAFFLMLLEGIQLSIYVFAVFHVHKKRHTFAMIFAAWFLPMVIVGISLGATRTHGYGDSRSCWLSFENGLVWAAFVAPVLVIIANELAVAINAEARVNIVILIAVLIQLARVNIQSTTGAKNSKIKSFFRNILVLLPLLGITWVFGVISVNEQLVAFQFIFAIANGLQGVFIFIFHAICNSKVRGSKKGRGSSSQAWNKKSNSKSQRNFVRLQDQQQQHEKTPPHYIGPFAVDSDYDLSANGSASNNSNSSGAFSRSTAETSASSDNDSRRSSDVTLAARRHKSFENNNGNARQFNGLTRRHTEIMRSGSDKSNDSTERLNESCAERHNIEKQISLSCDGDFVLRNDNQPLQSTPAERVNSVNAATSL